MKDKSFLDTNIFVYSFDSTASSKRETARRLIADALKNQSSVISFQVVQEFLNVATRKFATPLSIQDAGTYLREVLKPLCAVHSSEEIYRMALEIREESGYSFYDSLIVAGALQENCKTIFTEDLHSGGKIHGLKIVNPF